LQIDRRDFRAKFFTFLIDRNFPQLKYLRQTVEMYPRGHCFRAKNPHSLTLVRALGALVCAFKPLQQRELGISASKK
jgi:hypothetical protein